MNDFDIDKLEDKAKSLPFDTRWQVLELIKRYKTLLETEKEAKRQLEGMTRYAKQQDQTLEDYRLFIEAGEKGFDEWLKVFCLAFGGEDHTLEVNRTQYDLGNYELFISQNEEHPEIFKIEAVSKEQLHREALALMDDWEDLDDGE